MKRYKKRGKEGKVSASGGSKKGVCGCMEGGAQGLAMENARQMGSSGMKGEISFAVPVQGVGKRGA